MNTDQAQRRLLEALAVLDDLEDGTHGFLVALDAMVPFLGEIHPQVTAVFVEVGSLAAAASTNEAEAPGAARRLLEELSVLDDGPNGIGGLLVGLSEAIKVAETGGVEPLTGVWSALADLAQAVHEDRKELV